MQKHEIGDIIEVLIILVVLTTGLVFTLSGLFNKDSISGSSGRYYEAYEDYDY